MLPQRLSRRERQILDALFARSPATVAEVLDALPDPPSYNAVRTLLGILEEKGHVQHSKDGRRFVYEPVQSRQSVAGAALRQVVETFFGGRVERAVTTLLAESEANLSDDEAERLKALIEAARQEDTQ